MLPREFFEETSLYQKVKYEFIDENRNAVYVPGKAHHTIGVAIPPIKVGCIHCGSTETFRLLTADDGHAVAEYQFLLWHSREIALMIFECQACNKFRSYFLVEFNLVEGYTKKVGQEPGLPISTENYVEKALGESLELYKKGRICENFGFGIAAYAYYRRLVETKIDDLLTSITSVMSEEEAETFKKKVSDAKQAGSTAEKIRVLVPELPKSLFIAGNNPLQILYSALSEGLHNKTEDDCLSQASAIRIVLLYVYEQLEHISTSQRELQSALNRLQKGTK